MTQKMPSGSQCKRLAAQRHNERYVENKRLEETMAKINIPFKIVDHGR
jgi:hypothetical protein